VETTKIPRRSSCVCLVPILSKATLGNVGTLRSLLTLRSIFFHAWLRKHTLPFPSILIFKASLHQSDPSDAAVMIQRITTIRLHHHQVVFLRLTLSPNIQMASMVVWHPTSRYQLRHISIQPPPQLSDLCTC
jgi:hypothetical protein